jgi:16S rRNA (guanine527-N7)-methyltransferase
VTDGPPELSGSIADECARLGIAVPRESLPGLAAYAARLWAWNERLNLTRHTDVARFVSRDVGDASAIVPHLARGERILDVGTGGGVPGVLLAILRPDLRIELAESVGKRAAAVRAIVAEIGLDLPVHTQAGQTLIASRDAATERFDTLVVRAVAPLAKLLGWLEPLSDRFGRLLVIKGPRWEDELAAALADGLGKRVSVTRIAEWPIRGGDNQSVLLEVRSRIPSSARGHGRP